MKSPTPDQHTYLSNAVRRGDGRLCQPHYIETRLWLSSIVQMNKKGYVRWEGPRPFISETGLRALDREEVGTRPPLPVPVCKHRAGRDAGSQLGGN